MSKRAPEHADDDQGSQEKGPNLFVLYALLALALLGAMAVAAMIVWPFYVRR
jgi:hypothetical protein